MNSHNNKSIWNFITTKMTVCHGLYTGARGRGRLVYLLLLSGLLVSSLNAHATVQSRPLIEGYLFSILKFKSGNAIADYICGLKGWETSRVEIEFNGSVPVAGVYCIHPITENEEVVGGYAWDRSCGSPGFTPSPDGSSCISSSGAVIASKNPEPEQCPAGNPIHQGTGNKFQEETDYLGNGVYPLEFTRRYNSDTSLANHDSTTPAPLSPYWRSNYERRIISNVISSDPGAPTVTVPGPVGTETFRQVAWTARGTQWWPEISLPSSTLLQDAGDKVAFVLRPDGGQTYFVDTGTAGAPVWQADGDVTDTLSELTNAQGDLTGWQYINGKNEIETYDVAGRLITITSIEGHTQQLSYDIDGRLSSVTGEQGQSLTFTYDSEGRIATLTDHSSRVWGYRYDASNRLEYVDNPDGTTRQYHYEDAVFPNTNALTGITDERGIRYASWAYDSEGRAIMSTHADNAERVDIVYNADGTRTLTNSLGYVSTYTTMAQNGVQLIPNIIGPGCGSCGISDTHYEYDANNKLIAKVDKGIRTEWGDYDARGNAGFMIDAAGTIDARRTDYTYDPRFNSKVTSMTTPSLFTGQNRVTSYSYDAFGNRTSQQVTGYRPDGTPISRTTSYQYNGPLNQLSQVDGSRSDTQDITTLNYYADDPVAGDNRARLRQVITSTSNSASITLRDNLQYSATGQLLSEQRPNGLTLTYTYYPGNDRLETVTENGGATNRTTRWTYLATGEVATITTGYGTLNATTLTLDYDDARRLTSITDALGHSLSYTLDTEGNIIQQQNHDAFNVLRQTLTQTFDAYNRLESRIGAATQTTTFGYDANGNLDSRIDANNVSSSSFYDSLQRLTRVSNAPGDLSLYHYDIHDNLTQVTDPNNNTTAYQYDDLGNLIQLTSPDTGITTYAAYDGAGNAGQMTDANGNTTVYQYDALNRLILATYQNGTTTQYHYDDVATNTVGRLSTIIDPSGTTNYQYSLFGEVTQLTQTVGSQTFTTDYRYDTSGRLDQIIYPSGALIDYAYTAGRISAININGVPLLNNVTYYPFGPAESWQWGNNSSQSRRFDLDGQLTQYRLNGNDWTLQYDPAGNLNNRSSTLGTLTYGYDDLNRLTNVSGLQTQAFQYDANGNRIQLTDGIDVSDYTVAANSNRITGITGAQAKTYSFDANGNTLNDGTNRFIYNARNRMASANGVGYRHNGLGQRVAKQGGSGLYYGDASNDGLIDQADFDQTVAAILEIATPTGNTDCNGDGQTNVVDLVCLNHLINTATPPQEIQNSTYFAYDLQGQLIGEYSNDGSAIQESVYFGNIPVATIKQGNIYYIHTDQLNTPRAISDVNNVTLWAWESAPFGETAANEDVDGDGVSFGYGLRFPGQYFDVETGLHYNYFRDYDPGTGRYSQSDPIGLNAGLNTYSYVYSRPLQFTDMYGLSVDCTWVANGYYEVITSELVERAEGEFSEVCFPVPNPTIGIPDPTSPKKPSSPVDIVYTMKCISKWVTTKEAVYKQNVELWMSGYMQCTDTCTGEVTNHWSPNRRANNPPNIE